MTRITCHKQLPPFMINSLTRPAYLEAWQPSHITARSHYAVEAVATISGLRITLNTLGEARVEYAGQDQQWTVTRPEWFEIRRMIRRINVKEARRVSRASRSSLGRQLRALDAFEKKSRTSKAIIR
jgi:hypothetical protein